MKTIARWCHIPRLVAALFLAQAFLLTAAVQANDTDKQTVGLAERTELSVPTSPAFALLGVGPSQVVRPGFARDLNFDTILDGKHLKSDVAVDFQPIWMLGFGKVSVEKYREMGWVKHTLSSLSVSLGTANRDSLSSLAYGVRLTLFRQTDPLLDNAFTEGVLDIIDFDKAATEWEIRRMEMVNTLEEMEASLAKTGSGTEENASQRKLIEDMKAMIADLDTAGEMGKAKTQKQLRDHIEKYRKEHWNDAVVDVGFGQVFNYEDTSVLELDFASKGVGAWLSGAMGMGNKWQLTGQLRYQDVGEEIDRQAGLNLHYGGASTTAFVEMIWSEDGDQNMGFGAEFRIKDDVVVEAGVRANLDEAFQARDLIPEVKMNWSMLKKLL